MSERDGATGYFDFVPTPMAKAESEDGYWYGRSARQTPDDSDAASISSFCCSLGNEFDQCRRETDDNRNGPAINLNARQARLDDAFKKLAMKYRGTSSSGDTSKGSKKPKAKPHFLDLSAIICPFPTDMKTPPASNNRSIDEALTPRPSHVQRFASADHVPRNLSSDPIEPSLLYPLYAANIIPVGGATSGPTAKSFRPPALSQFVPNSNNDDTICAQKSAPSRPVLRSRRSFENPSEIRRRQKDDWFANDQFERENRTVPQLPEWVRDQSSAMVLDPSRGSDRAPSAMSTHSVASTTSTTSSTKSTGIRTRVRGMSFSAGSDRKAPRGDAWTEMLPPMPQLSRSFAMTRGHSHEPSTARSPESRPKLPSRSSSTALKLKKKRPQDDRWEATPPSMPHSRESYGSSTGSESMPPTPVSATYLRPLPPNTPPRHGKESKYAYPEGKEYVLDLQHMRGMSPGYPSHGTGLDGRHARSGSESSSESEIGYLRPGSSSSGSLVSGEDDRWSASSHSVTSNHGNRTPRPLTRSPYRVYGEMKDGGALGLTNGSRLSSGSDRSNELLGSSSLNASPPRRRRAESRTDEWAATIGRKFAMAINARERA